MAQKKQVYKESIKHAGYWKYSEVYGMMFNWLKDHNYNVKEDSYMEKVQGNGKEIIIKWNAGKSVTDYFKFQIQLDWHILGMNDTEVEIDGKKVKTNKGDIKITFKGNLIKDYESRWEDHPFWKTLRGLYEKYIIKESVGEYEGDLEDDTREIISDLKAFLKLEVR